MTAPLPLGSTKWNFRVATDPRFGAGHVARSAALARAFGGGVAIFIDPGSGAPEPLAAFRCSTESATDQTGLFLRSVRAGSSAAIFDSPVIPEAVIAEAAGYTWTAAFRDGPPYGAEHVSVDLSPGALDAERVLGGPAWAPLAPDLAGAHEAARRATHDPSAEPRVLVAFGARDSVNRTGLVLTALQRHRLPVTVVLGRAFEDRRSIEAACERSPAIRVAVDPKSMIDLYLSHDLAIGAPGVSQFERACCGLPTILVPQNERQVPLAAAWERRGCALAAPPTLDGVARALDLLLTNDAKRRSLRAAALDAVDGRGAARLAAALTERATSAITR